METYTLTMHNRVFKLVVTDRKILIDVELTEDGKEIPIGINSFFSDTDIHFIITWAEHTIKSLPNG